MNATLFLAASLALAVPAPTDQATLTSADLAGSWLMAWGDTIYHVELRPDGLYECEHDDCAWEGRWSIEARKPVIEERSVGSWVGYTRHELELSTADLSGRVDGYGVQVQFRRK